MDFLRVEDISYTLRNAKCRLKILGGRQICRAAIRRALISAFEKGSNVLRYLHAGIHLPS